MRKQSGWASDLKKLLTSFPICTQIAIGNAVINIFGAMVGIFDFRAKYFLFIFTQAANPKFFTWMGLCISTSTFLTRPALHPLIDPHMRIDNNKTILTVPAHAQLTSWDDQNKSAIEFSRKLLHEHRNLKGYLTACLCGS